ncbi:MAG: ABC transporter substrate-binding protein, partial [Acidimicrobiia bacterium]|nr:ABC transporter substrate-binding protein [Acidimicrobiia bacterium]
MAKQNGVRSIDTVRYSQGSIGNHVIDEYVGGRLSRRAFLVKGTVVGISLPVLGAIIAACGGDDNGGVTPTTAGDESTGTTASPDTAAPAPGGTLVIGSGTPSAASANLDPVLINDQNGLTILSSVGQTLLTSNPDLSLSPLLATEWSPNEDGSVWTFKLNPAATFSDGSPVTAADVVATMERLVNPDNNSNALSAFEVGRLSPGGTTAIDDATVVFTLDGPMGNFPYIVSSDNYNSFILPASVTDTSSFATAKIPTTGAYVIDSYDGVKGATLVRNPNYWGPSPTLDTIEFQFIDDLAAQITAFTSGDLDVISQFSVSGGESLIDDPDVNIIEHPSTAHRQIHLRTSRGPFADKRIRKALAIAMDRQAIVDGLFQGKAAIAHDSPFFDVFPSTGTP